MNTKTLFRPAALVLMMGAAFAASQANAAGFQLTEQSAVGLGRAYAGVGVDGADLSGAYYNPATMTLHPGTNIQAGVVAVDLNLDYEGANGSTDNGRTKPVPVPHMYLTHQVNDQIFAGLAITAPFGMQTEYSNSWDMKDRGYYSKIVAIDINPSLAWKINEQFSVAAGVSYQYVQAKLKTAKLGLADSTFDADSGDWGWNIGMMWTPVENFRLGLSYRSEIEHTAKGDLTVTPTAAGTAMMNQYGALLSNPGALAGNPKLASLDKLGALVGTNDGEAVVAAPAWAMLNLAWDINQTWSVYSTLRWTDWSSFERLSITTGGNEATAIENKWRDTYLFTVGADYHWSPKWTFRAGIGMETSPIKDAKYRTGVIPDAKRLWLSVGASYKFNDNLTFDIGGSHLRGLGERDVYLDEAGKQYAGEFKSLDAYLLGAQIQYRF